MSSQSAQPGIAEDTGTFLRAWDKEETVARYCKFDRRDKFREFVLSGRVLMYYLYAFSEKVPGMNGVRQRDVLAYIRDHERNLQSREVEAFMNDPVPRMAYAVVLMESKIRSAFAEGCVTKVNESWVIEDLRKKTGKTVCFPPARRRGVPSPDLGPFTELNEGKLEAYNRCFNLLMYVNASLGDHWDLQFGRVDLDSKWNIIPDTEAPKWMRPRASALLPNINLTPTHPDPSGASQHQIPQEPTSPTKPISTTNPPPLPPPQQTQQTPPEPSQPLLPIHVTVTWIPTAKAPWAKSLLQTLQHRNLAITDLTTTHTIKIHATETAEEVRDHIRAKFDMEDKLHAQIRTLVALPAYIDVMKEEWEVVRDMLWADEGARVRRWRMTLREVEAGEDIWEV
ncbi:hypothetical protein DM02DRAFT_634438 [Periconia macrospinosa]|uniref:Uncharacterized protein n=1 Tax=Periconia macrospinosa TaxID=97972 RepID=A0A2V1D646_9PLEO|nr:hypothetical protein DM02DRAFT_634438 [Periconia macrospinosa]